jgi:hypothetical protein
MVCIDAVTDGGDHVGLVDVGRFVRIGDMQDLHIANFIEFGLGKHILHTYRGVALLLALVDRWTVFFLE